MYGIVSEQEEPIGSTEPGSRPLGLDLSFQQLTTVPSTIELKNISHLNLSNNNLTVIQQCTFETIPNLTYLDLSKNAIKFLHEDTFLYNSKLAVLNLCKNRITVLPENIFFDLSFSLQELYICCNHIKELPLSIAYLKNLNHISFHSNPILYIDSNLDYFLQSVPWKGSNNKKNSFSLRKNVYDSFAKH